MGTNSAPGRREAEHLDSTRLGTVRSLRQTRSSSPDNRPRKPWTRRDEPPINPVTGGGLAVLALRYPHGGRTPTRGAGLQVQVCLPQVRRRAKPPSQPQDDQGRVVRVALCGEQVGEEGVGQRLGFRVPVVGEGCGEAAQTAVDVLRTALDQSVGVQDEGGALGEGDARLR